MGPYEDDPAALAPAPTFTCQDLRSGHLGYLHTHARMQDVLYHFGYGKLAGLPTRKTLHSDAEKQWQYLNAVGPGVKRFLEVKTPQPVKKLA